MDFAWHENKRLSNLEDHGVDFQDAALIFLCPVIEAEDIRMAYGEQRYRALGRVEGDYFMIAYTWRGEKRRIISAWKVNDEGKRRYEAILAEKPSGEA